MNIDKSKLVEWMKNKKSDVKIEFITTEDKQKRAGLLGLITCMEQLLIKINSGEFDCEAVGSEKAGKKINWLIVYEDNYVDNEMFTSEKSARRRLKQVISGWNCCLFKQIPASGT